MKKIFKYLFFLLPGFLLFGGGIFIQSYYAAFLFDTQNVEVELSPEESHVSTFNISFDETYTPYTEGEATYSISPITLCDLEDEETGDCIDEVPNLCPYLSLSSTDGETTEIGFEKNTHNFNAYGELNKPVDETDTWQLSIDAPCFEGECPSDYDEDLHGAPLPQSMKGETFECNLYLSPNEPPPQVRNIVSPKVALADSGGNTIHVTAKFGGVASTRDPVIIIPGTTGSYLFKDYGNKGEIWPNVLQLVLPGPDTFLSDLALSQDGTERLSFPLIVGDIIRREGGAHIFDGLIQDLEDEGYVEGEDLFVFSYDWRMSNAYNAILLSEKIEDILEDSAAEKVDIIVHSMGGILAKAYIAEGGSEKIDQLIFLGTPHTGAPKAFKALMYGDDMGFGIDLFGGSNNDIRFLNPQQLKIIIQNMPAVYELLPSQKYINDAGGYVINQENENNPLTLNYAQTKSKMLVDGRNPLMFPFAENLHNDIDDMDLSGIEVHNFVGCGGKTVGEITFKRKLSWVGSTFQMADDFDLKYVNGDSTVPEVSAGAVDGGEKYFVKGISHGTLPSADGVKEAVVAILKGDEVASHENILSSDTNCNISGKNVSVHSPVELHIYDEAGNHTGPLPSGDIENKIPGVEYDIIGGEKFAFLPDGENYKVVTEATTTGGYDLVVKSQNSEDEVTSTDEWKLIPLESTEAKGEIMLGEDHPREEYEVRMDSDGDGVFEETIEPTPPAGPFHYLDVLRSFIKNLDLKPKVEKALLEKVDKLEKKLKKKKDNKFMEKLEKIIEKVKDNKGKFKKFSQSEKDVLLVTINSLLDSLK